MPATTGTLYASPGFSCIFLHIFAWAPAAALPGPAIRGTALGRRLWKNGAIISPLFQGRYTLLLNILYNLVYFFRFSLLHSLFIPSGLAPIRLLEGDPAAKFRGGHSFKLQEIGVEGLDVAVPHLEGHVNDIILRGGQ